VQKSDQTGISKACDPSARLLLFSRSPVRVSLGLESVGERDPSVTKRNATAVKHSHDAGSWGIVSGHPGCHLPAGMNGSPCPLKRPYEQTLVEQLSREECIRYQEGECNTHQGSLRDISVYARSISCYARLPVALRHALPEIIKHAGEV
jgi:hypothetical protein